jgi:hypothetical protein
MKKHNIMIRFIYSILTLLTIMVIGYGIMLFYPYRHVEYSADSFKTDKTEYMQGETGYYTVNYCKYNDTMPEIHKFFVDSVIIEMSNQVASLVKGCNEAQIAFKIPNINPDEYQIEIKATYKYNPFQKPYVSKNTTNWFTIKLNPINDIDKE